MGYVVKLRSIGEVDGIYRHVYPMFGLPKGVRSPSRWVAMDILMGAPGREIPGVYYLDVAV
jgi:hypothetical protein